MSITKDIWNSLLRRESLLGAALITGRYQHRFGHESQTQRDASKVDTIARLPGLPDWHRST